MTSTTQPTRPDTEHQTAKVNRWTAILGAISALLLVVSALLGFFNRDQAQQIEQAEKKVAAIQTASAAVADEVAAISSASANVAAERDKLQAENGRLTSENISLAEQIKDLGSSTSASTDPPGQTPSIRHKGELTVTPKTGSADLDAPSDDLQWGRNGSGAREVGIANTFQTFNAGKTALIQGSANYATCQSATLQTGMSYELTSLKPGWTLCVYTSNSRTALPRTQDPGVSDV